jgi:hypothetical protein
VKEQSQAQGWDFTFASRLFMHIVVRFGQNPHPVREPRFS